MATRTRPELAGAQFNSSNLSSAFLSFSMLSNANLANANLTNVHFDATILNGADLSGALIAGARFGSTTERGFTKEQLYTTASCQSKDLRDVYLGPVVIGWQVDSPNDLTGWSFHGQNLSGAQVLAAILTNADFSGADVRATSFGASGSDGRITENQLYSTPSYQAKDLNNISLYRSDLTGWNLAGQNLADSLLLSSILTNANLGRGEPLWRRLDPVKTD